MRPILYLQAVTKQAEWYIYRYAKLNVHNVIQSKLNCATANQHTDFNLPRSIGALRGLICGSRSDNLNGTILPFE